MVEVLEQMRMGRCVAEVVQADDGSYQVRVTLPQRLQSRGEAYQRATEIATALVDPAWSGSMATLWGGDSHAHGREGANGS